MKTLHFYLIRQVLATLVMTVLVFTFVLLLGNGLKQIMPLLINQQAPVMLVGKAALLLIPWVLAYALPIGMLTAALLVFGRFSADQELLAARASGISLVSLVTPVILLSLALSGVCAWLNCEVAPRCRVAFIEVKDSAILSSGAIHLRSGQTYQIGQYSIYAGKVSADGLHLETVRIWVSDKNGNLDKWCQAPSGTISFEGLDKVPSLALNDAYGAYRTADGWLPGPHAGKFLPPITPEEGRKSVSEVQVSDMTLRELLRKIQQVEAAPSQPTPGPDQAELKKRIKEMKEYRLTSLEVNLHREIAFSFACIGFTLVGIPLGIRSNRRETSVGIFIALALLALYYSFVALGLAWENQPERFPQIFMWLPNLIFQAVGGFLLWRANRRG